MTGEFIEGFLDGELTGEILKENQIELFYASPDDVNIGHVWDSDDYLQRPHHAYFQDVIPIIKHPEERKDWFARREIELKMESVRREKFSFNLNRKTSIFLNWCFEDAREWTRKPRRRNNFIYQLEFVAESRCSIHSITWFDYAVSLQKGAPIVSENLFGTEGMNPEEKINSAIESYWLRKPSPVKRRYLNYEILVEGQVKVLKKR